MGARTLAVGLARRARRFDWRSIDLDACINAGIRCAHGIEGIEARAIEGIEARAIVRRRVDRGGICVSTGLGPAILVRRTVNCTF
jgi:hypothetical protein